jgi:hypothetical protein
MDKRMETSLNITGTNWGPIFANAIKMGLPDKVRAVELYTSHEDFNVKVAALIDGHEGEIVIPYNTIEEAIDKLLLFC